MSSLNSPFLRVYFNDLRSSKNTLLHDLMQKINIFNGLGDSASKATRVDLLQSICKIGGTWATSKPPQLGKQGNKARWNGLTALMDEVGERLEELGVRSLSGPSDFRKIDNKGPSFSYWLELLDPYHRSGQQLSGQFQQWLCSSTARVNKQSFWAWLGSPPNESVKYLSSSSELERFRVWFMDQRLVELWGEPGGGAVGMPFSTEQHATHFSGLGWAIFVVSPTREIYAGTHELDRFHHSTFLGGRPVMAAGEIVVEDGVVKAITAKSGHYRPTVQDMQRMVQLFPQIPNSALIWPIIQQPLMYRVGDFRAKGMNATPLGKQQVLAALPNWCKNEKSDGWLAKL